MLCTSNGSPYLNWQTRIMYRTFQKVQPGSDMLHFTRLLHRRSDDELMAEVPTVRVDSLHAACDKWCEFPVADRPDALRKWLQTDDSRRGEWIVMIETDYVWKRPLSLPPRIPGGGVPLPLHQPELSQTSRGDDENSCPRRSAGRFRWRTYPAVAPPRR